MLAQQFHAQSRLSHADFRDGRRFDENAFAILSRICTVEAWGCDLEAGIVWLGPIAGSVHGASDDGRCGILNLVKPYDHFTRSNVLGLIEVAASDGGQFWYSASVETADSLPRSVICLAETQYDRGVATHISGYFLFPELTAQHGLADSIR